ncbi:GNAT family N-acetyltransferase [Halobacteriales archaeon QS_3_64_16]|nr:MAG: GNAT family N-acetyltransferase [Halobacteriales archaeon QS_3_64_16]
MSRVYPEELAREFERPPFEFDDEAGREIAIRPSEGEAPNDEEENGGEKGNKEFEALVEMYVAFDPADRAQGIPPARESQVREWLGTILEGGCDVLAWYGGECVGHATLVPDGEDAYELAIFVLDEYQRAGIGSQLMEGLLGHGQAQSAERVWLTVERWNDVAMALYRKFGFETSDTESFELEMALRLQ